MSDRSPPLASLLMVGLLAAACGETSSTGPSPPDPRTRPSPLGEQQGAYPNYGERAVQFLTNRARTEPSAFEDDTSYDPNPPLRWDLDLAEAARWQARHISEDDCWCEDHSSCCRLDRTDGAVECTNAPGGCGQTSPERRVGFWSSTYSGENAGRGYRSARRAVAGWIESAPHWRNINSARHSLLGPGHHGSGWVQDFGTGGRPPVVSSGIHLPNDADTRFGLVYYQPGTGGPRTALLVLDGQCHDLQLGYGSRDHGTFRTSAPIDDGCSRYYFHVTDGRGEHHTYPSEGSLGVAAGPGADCPLYRRSRPSDACSPTGQSCETGQTRPCYTGPFGTEDIGLCEAGSRRCVGGEWQQVCRYQTRPKSTDTCGNARDDDCDGTVDESCGTGDAPDAGAGDVDPESAGAPGCRQTDRAPDSAVPGLLAALLLVVSRRSNRTPSDPGRSR